MSEKGLNSSQFDSIDLINSVEVSPNNNQHFGTQRRFHEFSISNRFKSTVPVQYHEVPGSSLSSNSKGFYKQKNGFAMSSKNYLD